MINSQDSSCHEALIAHNFRAEHLARNYRLINLFILFSQKNTQLQYQQPQQD